MIGFSRCGRHGEKVFTIDRLSTSNNLFGGINSSISPTAIGEISGRSAAQ